MTSDVGADREVGAPSGLVGLPADQPAATVVRHEERARVAFPVRVRSRVRLVKEVVTEEVTQTFTLRREVLRVEEEPGDPGADLSWDTPLEQSGGLDLEIVLHAEQVVVTTKVVPTERIRVGRRMVTADVLVSAELRSEQVEVEQVGVEQEPRADHEHMGTTAGGALTSKETPA